MTLRHTLVIALICFHVSAFAESLQKTEDIKAIVELTGMQTWFQERSEARFARAIKLVDQAKESVAPYTKSLSPQQKQYLERSLDRFVKDTQKALSPDEQLRVWAEAYGASISEEEARQIRSLYESPLGKALVRSTSDAANAVAEFNSRIADQSVETAFQRFLSDYAQVIGNKR